MSKKYKALICEPHKAPYLKEMDGTLEQEQEVVGGLIEAVYPPLHADNTCIICNDEGKIMGLDANRELKDESGNPYDVICGTFFVTATDDEGDFADLTDEQIEKYTELYKEYLPKDYAETHAGACEPMMGFQLLGDLWGI